METKIAEIADGIFRLSTYVPQIAPPAGFAFNSFLVRGEQPLLFHTGLHKMFPLNREAVANRIEEQAELDERYARTIQELLETMPNPADQAAVVAQALDKGR